VFGLRNQGVRKRRKRGVAMRKMRKSKCRHCIEGLVFNEDGEFFNYCYCDIENEDASEGCQKGYCNFYERKKESEVKP
jgi:hypothetical protein